MQDRQRSRARAVSPTARTPSGKKGTAAGMQERIRQTILRVPRGRVSTYGDVARAAGYPGAARQVVWTLHSSHGLPWHRIVGAGGEIKLRGENALEQRLRLESEGIEFRGRRVNMEKHRHFSPRRKAVRRRRRPSR